VRQVRCSYDGSRVVLHGRVSSYYLKQVAQVLAQQVAGVLAIDNRIDVVAELSTDWLEVEETEADGRAAPSERGNRASSQPLERVTAAHCARLRACTPRSSSS
jgi:hypothetical protein